MTLFENLELIHNAEGREKQRAAVLANTRAKNQFGKFLRSASLSEFSAKLNLVSTDLGATIRDACVEEGCGDAYNEVAAAVVANLRSAAEPVSDGDSYWQEHQDLPKAGPEGRSDEASGGPFDPNAHGDWKGWSTPSLEVPSNEHPAEMQSIEDEPNLWTDTEIPGLIDKQKVDQEYNQEVGEGTSVFGPGNQAQPVTSATYPDTDYNDAGQGWSEPTKPDFNPMVPGSEQHVEGEDDREYGDGMHGDGMFEKFMEAVNGLMAHGMGQDEALGKVQDYLNKVRGINQPQETHLDSEDLQGMHQQGEEDPALDAERMSNANIQGISHTQARSNAGANNAGSKWRIA